MTRHGKIFWMLIPIGLLLLCAVLLFSNWGLTLGLRVASATLPGELSVGSHQGTLLGPVRLRDVSYRDDHVSVAIRQLDLDWRSLALFNGRLELSRLAVSDIAIDIKPAPRGQASTQQAALVLPIAVDVQHASVDGLKIRTAPGAEPVNIEKLRLSAHTLDHTIAIRQFVIAAYQARLTLSGTVSLTEAFPLTLSNEASYQFDAEHRINSSGTISGDLRELKLSQDLSGLLQAKLAATVTDPLAKLHWRGQLDIARFDLHSLIAKSPAVVVQGRLSTNGDLKTLHVDSRLRLNSKRIGQANLHVTASSDLQFTKYRFAADGDFTGVELPVANLSVQGEGDHRQLQLSRLHIVTLKGNAKGHARVSWQPGFDADANLVLHRLQTGMLFKQWPGQISGELSLQSQAAGNRQSVRFMLRKFHGDVRGFPVQGEARGTWAKNLLVLDKLRMDVGGTNLTAHGKLARQWDLSVSAQSDNLNDLLPSARGSFRLSGHLGGTAKAPRVQLQGEASQLAYAQTAVAALNVKLDLGLAGHAPAQIDIQASSLQTRAGHWNTIQLQTAGNNAAHVIKLDAVNDAASMHAAWHGKFVPWRWQGSLDQFQYQRTGYGLWQLQQPVDMLLAKNAVKLSKLCLVQNGSQLCTQGQWDDKQRKASLDVRSLPLTLLEPWLPKNLQLGGLIDIQASLGVSAGKAVQAQLAVHSPDKSVVIHFVDASEQLTLGAGSFTAEVDNKGLHALLHLPLSEGGGLDCDASLPGWSPYDGMPRAQPVKATLKLDRIPADVITRFIPDTARAQGKLQADFHISGSLGEPRLRGDAKWQNGSVLVPRLGIQISEVSAELKSTQTNTVGFVVKARSGQGDVQLEGQTRLAPEQGWPTQASLTSHNLEVINIPEAFILIDSRVDVALTGRTININGEVTVPRARMRPHSLPEGVVPLSRDVVIVREHPSEQPIRWLVSSHLRVKLGDQVEFAGFGLYGNLHGQMLLNDEPGTLVMAQGDVGIVNGTYRLRGQDLTIRRGRLIFSNTFIDDPALDVEAIRTIGTITAGVRLKGTLKKPLLSVFSEPTMSESDALSYLLFGHSTSQSTSEESRSVSNTASALGFVAGGYLAKEVGGRLGLDELRLDVEQSTQNTSLVMGKYLSSRLYLRYLSGIVESSSIVQLQYQLSRRIQIQTESGYRGSQSITGGDIFFTIEY